MEGREYSPPNFSEFEKLIQIKTPPEQEILNKYKDTKQIGKFYGFESLEDSELSRRKSKGLNDSLPLKIKGSYAEYYNTNIIPPGFTHKSFVYDENGNNIFDN